MINLRKLSVCLIAFIVAFFMFSPSDTSAASFPDVKQYKDEISYLADMGIISGFPDGTFGPSEKLTRLQGVRVLLKAKGITDYNAANPNFEDMKTNSNGYAEVAKAVQLGIISGKTGENGSKYFDPSGNLTRGQMAKIIVETKGYPIDKSHAFRDLPKSNGYYNYVSTLAAQGITEGYEDRTFKPNNTVTRQHFAVFVARMLDDNYKPKPRPTSYLMDKTMDYNWTYIDEGKTYLSTLRYIGPYVDSGQGIAWDLWKETDNVGNVGQFIVQEDKEALYQGFPESYFYVEFEYPVNVGNKYDDWSSGKTYTIISVDRVVTTKAGTFHNVIEQRASNGVTYYYAPNIGLIKTVENGKTYAELVKLTPRR